MEAGVHFEDQLGAVGPTQGGRGRGPAKRKPKRKPNKRRPVGPKTKAWRKKKKAQKKWDRLNQSRKLQPDLAFDAGLERYLSGLQSQGDLIRSNTEQERERLYQANFDPNNPFSNQALLQRELGRAHATNRLNFGQRGSLYSGGLEATDANLAHQGMQQQDQLLRGYQDQVAGLEAGQQQQLGQLSMSAEEALFEATQRMAANVGATTAMPRAGRGRRPRVGPRPRFRRR